jgi:hypothetical protein
MIRPMTSDVSALSGVVANSHQALHFVSSAPSKIPYGGFSPVRLQTRLPDAIFDRVSGRSYKRLPPASSIHPLGCPVIWTCVPSERAGRRFRPSGPVALGSASGYVVRRPLRLLWPHPSFWAAPPVSLAYFRRSLCGPEGPHFYLPELADVPPSLLRWPQGSATNPILGLAFARLIKARQPYFSTHRPTCGDPYEAATFAYRCGPPACWPRPGRDFYNRACLRRVASTQVGYDYRNVRFIPDRTSTGCSVSFVGCASNRIKSRPNGS